MKKFSFFFFTPLLIFLLGACSGNKVAEDIFADMGQPVPFATEEQLVHFEAGKEVFDRQFTPQTGLGPQFNLSSCGGCHEKPVRGGGAGRYRNFLLIGQSASDGSFSLRGRDGIQTHFTLDGESRVETNSAANVFATRNPIPMFGSGLIAEILEESIRENVDEEDANGDGISGKANMARSTQFGELTLARFGRKAQVSSLEVFIRAPLFNHLGITTLPLPSTMKEQLPVPIVSTTSTSSLLWNFKTLFHFFPFAHAQGGLSPELSLDTDDVADPELSLDDLFSLISFTMLLAVPQPDEPTEASRAGESLFRSVGCDKCHVPQLKAERGMIPLYSDLLLHDMGEEMADGIEMGEASGSEFRTQPLWGIVAVAPYLHDGRADTLDEAIRWHGGEAKPARDAYVEMSATEQGNFVAFLESLGGKSQKTTGLLAPDTEVPEVGQLGAPRNNLSSTERQTFLSGREVFDRDFSLVGGLGFLMNGDSCRACHFLGTIGGAGPMDVNVMRQGTVNGSTFTPPSSGTMIHRFHTDVTTRPEPEAASNTFEHRQTPPLFGLGLVNEISRSVIEALADPNDTNPADGISGRAHILGDSRLGRFGWKADVPSLEEFARDAMTNEMGISLPSQAGLTFGATSDNDNVTDPELSSSDLSNLVFFMNRLGPPPRTRTDTAIEDAGETIFANVGCTKCHVPTLQTSEGEDVNLYSDLLLHDVAPSDFSGIESGDATMREFRTPPLWGLAISAPYMHDGRASTIQQAIEMHEGEAVSSGVRANYNALSSDDRNALLRFLESL